MNPNPKNPKTPQNYFCELCDFNTCNKKDYTRHLLTNKHKILINPNENLPKNPIICSCGKTFKHLSTLSAHKKNV